MAITAMFSNGTTDTYKGDRKVTAAWLLTLPDGRIFSGHSMTLELACKTAARNAGKNCPFVELVMKSYTPASAVHYTKLAKERGFDTLKAYNADRKSKRADWIAQCKIEVVAL